MIIHSLSYPLQAGVKDFSPRFSIECQLLMARVESVGRIAASLGVSSETVVKVLKEALPDFRRLKLEVNPWKLLKLA